MMYCQWCQCMDGLLEQQQVVWLRMGVDIFDEGEVGRGAEWLVVKG